MIIIIPLTHACLFCNYSLSLLFFCSQGKQNPSEFSPPQAYNVCTIMYTSGTSGNPKGVVLTHETIAFTVRGIDLFLEQFEDKVNMILNLIDNLHPVVAGGARFVPFA